MQTAVFDEANLLKLRIQQLKMLKNYLEHLLNGYPFRVEIKTSILGQESITPFPFINSKIETLNYMQDTEDADFIVDCLQRRIDELEKKFSEL